MAYFNPAAGWLGKMTYPGAGAGGGGMLGTIGGALGPIGLGLGIVSTLADLWGGHKAKQEEEKMEKKRKALEIVQWLGQSREGAGRRWGY